MSEISLYEAQVKKMQGICDEHDLVYRFKKDSYPITFTIKPAQDMESQMSMLENVEEVGYRSPDASMMWIFEDGTLTTKVQGGTFTIGKTLRTKIEAILVKMINYCSSSFSGTSSRSASWLPRICRPSVAMTAVCQRARSHWRVSRTKMTAPATMGSCPRMMRTRPTRVRL